jgi:hypothetical protein
MGDKRSDAKVVMYAPWDTMQIGPSASAWDERKSLNQVVIRFLNLYRQLPSMSP